MTITELLSAAKENKILPNEFLKQLWILSTGIQRQARMYDPKTITIYRTRVFKDDIRPNKVEELSYPPLQFCKLQRASEEGEQVFYASAGMPTTLAESRVNEGEYIIVSKWKNIKQLIIQEIGLKTIPSEIEQLYRDIFTARDETMYKYSSKVAQHLMGGNSIDGLLYPSIINQNKSHNIVLKKDSVDMGLEFVNASLYKITKISSDNKFDVEELDFATVTPGKLLNWKGRKKHWVLRKQGQTLSMQSNGWDWEAYTTEGEYVDPE